MTTVEPLRLEVSSHGRVVVHRYTCLPDQAYLALSVGKGGDDGDGDRHHL